MTMDELVANARQLFAAPAGSDAQRTANHWLVNCQASRDGWRLALHVLERSSAELLNGASTLSPEVLVVVMQIVRHKIARAWGDIGKDDREAARQVLLQWLRANSRQLASAPAVRVACVVVADLVVKMHCDMWSHWLQELLEVLGPHESQSGMLMLLEIYSAIPGRLQTLLDCHAGHGEVKLGRDGTTSNTFLGHTEEVVRAAIAALAMSGDLQQAGLRCVEHWCVGCVPAVPSLGIGVPHLGKTSLLTLLMDIVIHGPEDASQAAGEIVADIFAGTPSDPNFISPTTIAATVQAVARLAAAQELFQQPFSDREDLVVVRCRSLARVASSIALNHAIAVFTPDAQDVFDKLTGSPTEICLTLRFLEIMLTCSSYPDTDSAQSTLEFWFFLLDASAHNGVQLQLLSNALPLGDLADILGQLVNTLIRQCQYPAWTVEALCESSASLDDSDFEDRVCLRKEVADTLLSLFSKWPTYPPNERAVSCVKGMAALLRPTTDIATLDAVLYLLEYTIELFDIDSSDSDCDDVDEESDGERSHASNEGAQLLQHILLDALQLAPHPLLIRGTIRFLQSLSKSIVLPGDVYVQAALYLCRGLQMEVVYGYLTHELLGMSRSITRYSEPTDRRELLELLAQRCQDVPLSKTSASGDLLEAAFRLTSGLSETDFSSFCNAVLTTLTDRISSPDHEVAGSCVVLIGRAIGGVEEADLRAALANQVWPLVGSATSTHEQHAGFRNYTLQFFSAAIASNPCTSPAMLVEVVRYSLLWLPTIDAVSSLKCLAGVVSNTAAHQPDFVPLAEQIVEGSLALCAGRLHFDSAFDDKHNQQQLEAVFSDHERTAQLTPMITELFALLRLVVQFFPSSLATRLPRALHLAWLLLIVDHQVQELVDAACDFLLDLYSSSALLDSSPHAAAALSSATAPILRALLTFFGPKHVHYRRRNLWQFLFQWMHAPRVAKPLQDHIHATLTDILAQEQPLSPPLGDPASLAAQLKRLAQRHRFVTLLGQVAKQVEAMW